MVLVICDEFHAKNFVDQVPHGGFSAAKSFGESLMDYLGWSLMDWATGSRFRTFGQSEVDQILGPPPDCSHVEAWT